MLALLCLLFSAADAAPADDEAVAAAKAKAWRPIDLRLFEDSIHGARVRFKNEEPPYAVWNDAQIVHIAENLLAYQYRDGGWPKNVDWLRTWTAEELAAIRTRHGGRDGGTLDNSTTWTHVQYLAAVYQQTRLGRYAEAAGKGLRWIIGQQNERSGGWRGADVDAITFNDHVMAGVLQTLGAAGLDDERYGFVEPQTRDVARQAREKGIACVLRCQIRVGGQLTAWAQQHSHEDFAPVWGRSFEPPAITAKESVGVVRLLMEINDPPPEVVEAVQAAVTWFQKAKITGRRIERVPAEPAVLEGRFCDYDLVEVADPAAASLWTRFYDPENHGPIFCTRDGRITDRYADLDRERRTGYSFYGDWPADLLARDYPHWRERWTGRIPAPEVPKNH